MAATIPIRGEDDAAIEQWCSLLQFRQEFTPLTITLDGDVITAVGTKILPREERVFGSASAARELLHSV